MHYYQFNIGDYRRDTGHLSALEHGIYRMLLDSYYLNDGPLTADDAALMRSHCVRTADEQIAYQNVIKDFFILENGLYIHTGCDKVLGKIYAKSKAARDAAKARWANKNKRLMRTHSERNADAMHTVCEQDADGMLPITHNPLPITHKNTSANADSRPRKSRFQKPTVDELFLEFNGRVPNPRAEAEKFLAYYESNGWKIGKNPMKSWKHTVTTWVTRRHENGQVSGGSYQRYPTAAERTQAAFDAVFGPSAGGAFEGVFTEVDELEDDPGSDAGGSARLVVRPA